MQKKTPKKQQQYNRLQKAFHNDSFAVVPVMLRGHLKETSMFYCSMEDY